MEKEILLIDLNFFYASASHLGGAWWFGQVKFIRRDTFPQSSTIYNAW